MSYGEKRVQAVVVLDGLGTGGNHQNEAIMSKTISDHVEQQLGPAARPSQILYVPSTDDIPKGSTGKYLRTKMAQHFGVQSVDTRALRALQGVSNATSIMSDQQEANNNNSTVAQPSIALNGVRFLASYFVCQVHLGLYPSIAWTKIQSFSLSMPIFLFLAGFQMTCSTQSGSTSWSSFVGTKIGSMHAGVVVSQILALPASLVWQHGIWEGFENYPTFLREVAGQTLTGLYGFTEKNLDTSWFQTVLYKFIILFPFINGWIGSLSDQWLLKLGVVALLSSVIIPSVILNAEYKVYDYHISSLHYTIVTWLPHLVSAVFAGHVYRRFGPLSEASLKNSDDRKAEPSVFRNPQFWGVVTDTLSVSFLLLMIAVGLSPNCTYVNMEIFKEMRGENAVYDEEQDEIVTIADEVCIWACNVTWDEFVNHIHADDESFAMKGRWSTEIVEFLWCYRLASPVVAIWLYGLSFGHGLTARIMKQDICQFLSSLSYPVYMIHVPIARYYWLATRGFEYREFWYQGADYPFPITVPEVWLVILISCVLGYALDHYVFPHVMPHTVRAAMFVCENISTIAGFGSGNKDDKTIEGTSSVSEQVRQLVKGVSGVQVSDSSRLDSLGLDSLGASALLGILRARLSSAERLSIQDLAALETVGDLVDLLADTEPPAHGSMISNDKKTN